MILNKNKLYIAFKYISPVSFFIQRNIYYNYNSKNLKQWSNILWLNLLYEMKYNSNSKKIYKKDFNKFVLYFLTDFEIDNIFNYICNGTNYICNGTNYFTYDNLVRFLLIINENDYKLIINSFEKNKN